MRNSQGMRLYEYWGFCTWTRFFVALWIVMHNATMNNDGNYPYIHVLLPNHLKIYCDLGHRWCVLHVCTTSTQHSPNKNGLWWKMVSWKLMISKLANSVGVPVSKGTNERLSSAADGLDWELLHHIRTWISTKDLRCYRHRARLLADTVLYREWEWCLN